MWNQWQSLTMAHCEVCKHSTVQRALCSNRPLSKFPRSSCWNMKVEDYEIMGTFLLWISTEHAYICSQAVKHVLKYVWWASWSRWILNPVFERKYNMSVLQIHLLYMHFLKWRILQIELQRVRQYMFSRCRYNAKFKNASKEVVEWKGVMLPLLRGVSEVQPVFSCKQRLQPITESL